MVALEKLEEVPGFRNQDNVFKQRTTSIIDKELSKTCKKDVLSHDIVPQVLLNYWASLLWSLTSPFYES